MQFLESEARDAVRFSWNVWPSTRLEASRLVVPLSAMYTPIKAIDTLVQVPYEPIQCKGQACQAALNPFCQVDFMTKIWICPFCLTHNHFPHHYADLSPENLPAELVGDCTTIEYAPPTAPATGPPIFLFVVDTVVVDEELAQIRDVLLQSLQLLPPDALVGLITFGKNVHVHELGFAECARAHVLNGTRDFSNPQVVADLLSLKTPEQAFRFLMPIAECELTLTAILEDLARDPWPPVKADCRAARCTGVAMAVAVALLESGVAKDRSARIMSFIGGPPSVGPGMVVSPQMSETIRSHNDLLKGNAPHYTKAMTYYGDLAKRASLNGHVIDIFACALDQVGVAEMKSLVEKTGGVMVLHDTFVHQVFTESFRRVFGRDASQQMLSMAFGAELQVATSREIKVAGCIGQVTSLERKGASMCPEKEIGIGATVAWRFGGLDPMSTAAFYFDVSNQQAADVEEGRNAFVQFVTKYRNAFGQLRIRVTTVGLPYVI
jgi:protein transport protein SEC23